MTSPFPKSSSPAPVPGRYDSEPPCPDEQARDDVKRAPDGRRLLGIEWACALGHKTPGYLGDPTPAVCPQCVGADALAEIERLHDSVSRLTKEKEEAKQGFVGMEGRWQVRCLGLERERYALKADVERLTKERDEAAKAYRDDHDLLLKLLDVLGREVGKTGESEGAVDVAERLIRERDAALGDLSDARAELNHETNANRALLHERDAATRYATDLQRIIEDICHGREPRPTLTGARHHFEMARAFVAQRPPSPQANSSADKLRLIRDFVNVLVGE